jgi:hypothetical protein
MHRPILPSPPKTTQDTSGSFCDILRFECNHQAQNLHYAFFTPASSCQALQRFSAPQLVAKTRNTLFHVWQYAKQEPGSVPMIG